MFLIKRPDRKIERLYLDSSLAPFRNSKWELIFDDNHMIPIAKAKPKKLGMASTKRQWRDNDHICSASVTKVKPKTNKNVPKTGRLRNAKNAIKLMKKKPLR